MKKCDVCEKNPAAHSNGLCTECHGRNDDELIYVPEIDDWMSPEDLVAADLLYASLCCGVCGRSIKEDGGLCRFINHRHVEPVLRSGR